MSVFAPPDSRQWSLDAVEKDVLAGLPADVARLACAAKADDYYQCRNRKHRDDYRRPDEQSEDFNRRPIEYSYLTSCVVDKLSEPLYEPGPMREAAAGVDADLQAWWKDAAVNVRMAAADRAALIGHVAAVQAEPTGDRAKPVRTWLWKAHEFAVFTRDGDPTTPWAVCTIETVPDEKEPGKLRTRMRLWSAWERRTYLSEPYAGGEPWGRKMVRQKDDEEGRAANGASPYPGVLPFTFVRNRPGDSCFWEGGIGDALVEVNQAVDRKLSNASHHVDLFLDPVLWAKNVPAEHRLTLKPGQPVRLPSTAEARMGDAGEPELGYLQPALAIDAAWLHIKNFADQGLEELQIPLTVVRSDASTDLSGVAIVAKAVPLTRRTKARQPQFTDYEADLAARMLAVAGVWYQSAKWTTAAREPGVAVTWPEPVIPMPTAERNEADEWELRTRLADPIEVVARRRGMTLAQAEAWIAESAKRWERWNALMGEPEPEPTNEPARPATADDEGDEDADDDAPAEGSGDNPGETT
jgi:hypothetical protein